MVKKMVILFLILCNLILGGEEYKAQILSDENGNILEGENINLQHPLASLTKMMTSLIVLEKIKEGELRLEDEIRISRQATNIKGSSARLKKGEKISIEKLLEATIVRSGNDASYQLAEKVAGNEEKFVKIMNEKAKELEMTQTKFYTSTGLPPNMTGKKMDVGTANDILKLAIEIMKYPKYIEISKKEKISLKDGGVVFRNRNNFIGKYEGVDGLKTGHHSKANYNLVITVKQNGLRFIEIILGSPTEKIRDEKVKEVLDIAYEKYKKIKIADKNEYAITRNIKGAKQKEIKLYVEKDILIVKEDAEKWKLYKTAYLPQEIKAPIKKGEKIGYIEIEYRGNIIKKVNLISIEDVAEISKIRKLLRVLTFNLL
ncbi:MAG: hypothetical protein B6I28_05440 [Fusobacteriia bacterium 4572_132]|nr:MAG: hypothetical protein B6I28_05440 [Fusobacteriia bacterium 4572_132]